MSLRASLGPRPAATACSAERLLHHHQRPVRALEPDQVLEPDRREALVEDDVLVAQLAEGVDPVRGDDQQRAGADLGFLVADLGPQAALLDEHQLLGRMAVVGDDDAAPVDDPGHHRLLAGHRLAEDAGHVLDGRELVPGGDLSHSDPPAQVGVARLASRPRRIFSGVTGSDRSGRPWRGRWR